MVPCGSCQGACPFAAHRARLEHRRTYGAWPCGAEADEAWAPTPQAETASGSDEAGSPGDIVLSDELEALLAKLNPEQRAAAEHTDGPLLILAGPGSGKTTTVTARIAHLIGAGVAEGWRILGITFTRSAAEEIRQRVARATGEAGEHVLLGTFHSVALYLLRRHYVGCGLRRGFSVWADDTMKAQMRACIKDLDWGPKKEHRPKPKALLEIVGRHKAENRPWPSADLEADVRKRQQGDLIWSAITAYEDTKELCNALDYSDLIWRLVQSAQKDDSLRTAISTRWDRIHVDEAQDTSPVQGAFVQLLAPPGLGSQVAAVGDDDQSIYQFRGADGRFMREFELTYPGTTVVTLRTNYRSSSSIVSTCTALITNNKERRDKQLESHAADDGTQVVVRFYANQTAELNAVAAGVQKLVDQELAQPPEIAVLVRSRRYLYAAAAAFDRAGIPYVTSGIRDWWQGDDPMLIRAWIRVLTNPDDLDAAAYVLLRWPRIGPTRVQAWMDLALDAGGDPLDAPLLAMHEKRGLGLHTKAGKSLSDLHKGVQHLRQMVTSEANAPAIVDRIYATSGISSAIAAAGQAIDLTEASQATLRIAHEERLRQEADGVESHGLKALEDLNDRITTAATESRGREAVTLSTMHGSKGLEWDYVIIPGMAQGICPVGSIEKEAVVVSPRAVPAERCLTYVALSRARRQVVVCCPREIRGPTGKPVSVKLSQFIREAAASTCVVIPVIDQESYDAT